jgi:hypothetical protein
MHERECVRGCTIRGVHFATCADYGLAEAAEKAREAGVTDVEYVPTCHGCAPQLAREGAMVCDRCYTSIRRNITNAPDIASRLRSLVDPSKAAVYDRVRISGSAADTPGLEKLADLLDAAEDVMRTLRTWAVYVDPRSGVIGGMPAGAGPLVVYDYGRTCADVLLGDFDRLANRRDDIIQLGDATITRHPADEDGIRPFWSVVDAISRYRLERPDTAEVVWEPEDDGDELYSAGVHEWNDRIVTRADALRHAGSAWTLNRWMKEEGLEPVAVTYGPMGRVTWFRESALTAIAERMLTRVGGRPRKVPA